jgi:selT/selW/selH-like putative selenoprotein
LAAEIKKAKGVDAQVVSGARGAFEVYKDGQLVFSKLALGRFPTSEAEVLAKL